LVNCFSIVTTWSAMSRWRRASGKSRNAASSSTGIEALELRLAAGRNLDHVLASNLFREAGAVVDRELAQLLLEIVDQAKRGRNLDLQVEQAFGDAGAGVPAHDSFSSTTACFRELIQVTEP
jgi:hypothetical protein